MSYFEGQGSSWPQHGRQQSWDPPQRPHSGAPPPQSHTDSAAFSAQFEEVARASENLAKGGRVPGMHGRRESMPPNNSFHRQYAEFDPRMSGSSSRHHSVGEYDGARGRSSHASPTGLPGYINNQRFGPRQSEAEQVMQAKRKAAAQRERELRNYHQEQQYNRNLPGAKPDRSMSPNAMSEDDRRDLIARQHRALYGNESSLYTGDGTSSRPMSQDARVLAAGPGGHVSSPLGFDSFGAPIGGPPESGMPMSGIPSNKPRSRSNSNSSPATNPNSFARFETNQQGPNQTSSSSPGGSPTRQGAAVGVGGVAPIGTRPQGQAKRSTPPQPSPLGYGYPGDKSNQHANERSQSSASNPAGGGGGGGGEKPVGMGWGGAGQSGPWGPNKMQASVWG